MATITKTLNFPASNEGTVSVTLTLNYSITTNNATTHTITVSNVVLKNNASVTAAQVNTTNVKDFTVVYGGTTLWTFNTSFVLTGGASKTLTISKTSTTNKIYDSTQEKTLSLRCRPVTYSSVQVASATISIPARTRVISSVTLSASTLRVADGQSVSEEDEGTWCYGTCDYSIVGDASADVSLDISVTPSGPIIQPYENSVSKDEDVTLSGTLVFRASNCSTDLSYKFTITVIAQNTSDTSQASVTKSASDTLSLAFFTMDILGDAYLFNLTTDTSIDYNKTYYQLVDGSYQAIPVSDLQQDLLHTYYEKNGPRPGHGIAFGVPCRDEGFYVGMDLFFQQWAGTIQMFAGAIPPAGWLLCDGSAVSRTDYAALFAAIGTTWGAGDGSTTFNLPDLRGRAPIGAGTGSGLTARTLGGKLGSEAVQAHTHDKGTLSITSSGGHDHAIHTKWNTAKPGTSSGTIVNLNSSGSSSSSDSGSVYIASSTGAHTHPNGNFSGSTGSYGSGASGNMQPSAVVNFIIHTGKTN